MNMLNWISNEISSMSSHEMQLPSHCMDSMVSNIQKLLNCRHCLGSAEVLTILGTIFLLKITFPFGSGDLGPLRHSILPRSRSWTKDMPTGILWCKKVHWGLIYCVVPNHRATCKVECAKYSDCLKYESCKDSGNGVWTCQCNKNCDKNYP